MKKVVNGKLYNTETAEKIHEWNNGFYGNDFERCEESLYITKKGAFFICGSGGPRSTYAVHCGNMSTGGSDIIILTRQEALVWLEEHGGAEILAERFKEDIEEA